MTPTSYPEVINHMSEDPYRHVSHGTATRQVPGTFYDNVLYRGLPDNLIHAPVPGVAEIAFDPWLMEVPAYGSPISRSPSLSGSEVFSPPSTCFDVPSVYHLIDQPLPLAIGNMISHTSWAATTELDWHNQTQDNYNAWGAPTPMSTWSEDAIPPVTYNSSQLPEETATSLPAGKEVNMPAQVPVLSLPYVPAQQEGCSDSSDSDSDSDASEYDDDDSTISSSRKTNRSNYQVKHRGGGSLLKLGRWSMTIDSYTQPEQRHYACPFVFQPDMRGRGCTKRFVRPEHLRRHVKTVHGEARDYICKVPQCQRAFSRGDNLRDHYWTHISRGGRAGKNDKMSLADLKSILGPKEKKLVKRLKARLLKQKVKVRSKL